MGGGLRVQELYTGSCMPPFTLPEPTPNNSTQGAEGQALDYPSVVAAHCLIHYCCTGRQHLPLLSLNVQAGSMFITPSRCYLSKKTKKKQ